MEDPLNLKTYIIRKELKIIGRPVYDVLDESGNVVITARQAHLFQLGVPDFTLSDNNKNVLGLIHHNFSIGGENFELRDPQGKITGRIHQGMFNTPVIAGGLVDPFQLSDADGKVIAIAGGQFSLLNFVGNINYTIYDVDRKINIADISPDLSGVGVADMFKNLSGHAYMITINQKLISTLMIIEFVLAIDFRAEFQKNR
jgi:uncharacterized protein YxjI